jgi:hypothetical protein
MVQLEFCTVPMPINFDCSFGAQECCVEVPFKSYSDFAIGYLVSFFFSRVLYACACALLIILVLAGIPAFLGGSAGLGRIETSSERKANVLVAMVSKLR